MKKKNTMKKSRMVSDLETKIFCLRSGSEVMARPAMKAPISRERFSTSASSAKKKHQAKPRSNTRLLSGLIFLMITLSSHLWRNQERKITPRP